MPPSAAAAGEGGRSARRTAPAASTIFRIFLISEARVDAYDYLSVHELMAHAQHPRRHALRGPVKHRDAEVPRLDGKRQRIKLPDIHLRYRLDRCSGGHGERQC